MKHYLAIARPSHWFKNIFVLPGLVFGLLVLGHVPHDIVIKIILAIISVCLITSANYTINEWLDAEFDKHHPLKKGRPSVLGHIQYKFVLIQYVVLAIIGMVAAYYVSMSYFITSGVLLYMGFLYNVLPFRTKDLAYLDVLSESINNPLRLLLGWFIVIPYVFPPSSLLIAYWMGGAFLMAVKRYAELRLISDKATAELYRKSFRYYTENSLLVSILFYAMVFSFFFGVFMIKYRIEFLLSFPFFAILFAWYLHIGMGKDSVAQRPEKLFKETSFMIFCLFLVGGIVALYCIEIPSLHLFLSPTLAPR
jgi:decaprenyl-phosphate phosphoribosyltransferase